jgi:hypothetical protein
MGKNILPEIYYDHLALPYLLLRRPIQLPKYSLIEALPDYIIQQLCEGLLDKIKLFLL